MKILDVRNVHDALLRGLDLLYHEDRKTESRNGAVYESSTPVTTGPFIMGWFDSSCWVKYTTFDES